MKLVIVESPAKAQTINKYLGNDYKVMASVGHIRDLPSKDGAVLPDDNFKMYLVNVATSMSFGQYTYKKQLELGTVFP